MHSESKGSAWDHFQGRLSVDSSTVSKGSSRLNQQRTVAVRTAKLIMNYESKVSTIEKMMMVLLTNSRARRMVETAGQSQFDEGASKGDGVRTVRGGSDRRRCLRGHP